MFYSFGLLPLFSLSVFQPNSWWSCNPLVSPFSSKLQSYAASYPWFIYFASNFRLLGSQVETGQFISVKMSEVLKPFVCRVLRHLWNMLPVKRLCYCINEAYSSPAFVCLDFKLTAEAVWGKQCFLCSSFGAFSAFNGDHNAQRVRTAVWVIQNYSLYFHHYPSWLPLVFDHSHDSYFKRSLPCCLL